MNNTNCVDLYCVFYSCGGLRLEEPRINYPNMVTAIGGWVLHILHTVSAAATFVAIGLWLHQNYQLLL